MGDFVPFAGMIFSLLMALIVGGFVLMYPLTRRLGKLIELRLEERKSEQGGMPVVEEVERLRGVVEALQHEVAALAERQDFAERLLDRGAGGSGAPALGARGHGSEEET
jgi:hypothetical protein